MFSSNVSVSYTHLVDLNNIIRKANAAATQYSDSQYILCSKDQKIYVPVSYTHLRDEGEPHEPERPHLHTGGPHSLKRYI